MKRSDCILVYGSTTKGDVVKRSDYIQMHRSTTKVGKSGLSCTQLPW